MQWHWCVLLSAHFWKTKSLLCRRDCSALVSANQNSTQMFRTKQYIYLTYYFQQSITVPIRVVKKAHKHLILYMLGSHFYENTMSGRNRMVVVVLTYNKEAKTKSYWRKRQNINVHHPKRLQWSMIIQLKTTSRSS